MAWPTAPPDPCDVRLAWLERGLKSAGGAGQGPEGCGRDPKDLIALQTSEARLLQPARLVALRQRIAPTEQTYTSVVNA